ncbi:MAG: DUF952 domain-containing protein [Trebonia sp.]
MQRLFHIVDRTAWTYATAAGEYRPPSLATEGFVHFSFADQVAGTANLLYRDVEDLIVVEFAAERLGADVVIEDSTGSGTRFPHVYKAIPVASAVAIHALCRDGVGDYVFTPGRASGAASPDR